MQITSVGLDLAKNVIQLHAVNQDGKAVLKKSLRRNQVLPFFANLTPCLIGMEACSSAHYWARKLQTMGHRLGRQKCHRCEGNSVTLRLGRDASAILLTFSATYVFWLVNVSPRG